MTYIDLNDLVNTITTDSNDTFMYSRTNGLSVIGSADLLLLANMLIEDIVTSYSPFYQTTNNSGRYMDEIYGRMEHLKRHYDPGLVGLDHWYNFVDALMNEPLTKIIESHISRHGDITRFEIFQQAPNVWLIY